MDFDIPNEIQATLDALDEFIEREIKPWKPRTTTAGSSTTGESGPEPTSRTAACLARSGGAAARDASPGRRGRVAPARAAEEYGGRSASNLEMAIIREHLAAKGLGLHNDLRTKARSWATSPPS